MIPTRDAVHAELRAFAKAICKPEETPQQAYARAVTQTEIGKCLFGLYRAVLPAARTPERAAKSVSGITSGHSALRLKAAEIRKAEPKLTPAQAFAKAYGEPTNRALIEAHNRERRGLPLAVA
jgi:hypothetical protein